MTTLLEKLQEEFHTIAPLADRFCVALKDELGELLQTQRISLGVPIENRVKSWGSIAEKIERKSLELGSITDLPDLIGLRLILLFERDVTKACDLISKTFTVLHREDTQARLDESQFGYQSFHYLIQLPKNWLSVPSFASVGKFKAEIQIRTVAQHIWAAASHVLQYKQETSVPLPVRRSIHRVSALLETVDLEFERVLDARESYLSGIDFEKVKGPLNVDLLANVLDTLLPKANKLEDESYADLVPDLLHFGIDSTQQLQALISKHLDDTLKKDAKEAKRFLEKGGYPAIHELRLNAGVYLSHVGLIRMMLRAEFGERFTQYRAEKRGNTRQVAKPKRKPAGKSGKTSGGSQKRRIKRRASGKKQR